MPDPTKSDTPPKSEKQKRNNAPTIPPEFYDEVWRLHLAGELPSDIATELEKLGCEATRYSVNRAVNKLIRERGAAQQASQLRAQAIGAQLEANVALQRLLKQLDEVTEHLVESWEIDDREGILYDLKVMRGIRGAIGEQRRKLADADKALAKAHDLEMQARRSKQKRAASADSGAGSQGDSERQSSAATDAASSRSDVEGDPSPAGSPSTSAPDGTAEAPPENAEASWRKKEEASEDFDPNAAVATFALPVDGARLRKKPEVYSGKSAPNSKVIVSVDQDFMEEVPVDKNGLWRVLGAKVLGLKPGVHRATVTSVTPQGKFGRTAIIHFTLL